MDAQAATPSLQLPLQDRVAIVTGASRGIGHAISLHLASLGAKLILGYVNNSTKTELLATEINSSSDPSHPRAIAVQADISDPNQVKYLFDQAEQTFNSQPHILVNSAGVLDSNYPTIANTKIEDFDNVFNVNTRGTFLCAREAANRLTQGGGGRIIFLSTSMVGEMKPGFGAYTASKAAVETMMKILAKELKGTKITANCVAPGPIMPGPMPKDMVYSGKMGDHIKKLIDECPLSRLGETKDVIPVVGFLASDASEWVNGQVIRVNGGTV